MAPRRQYFTVRAPPVYVFSLAGFAALAGRRERRLLAFLGAWAVLMLLPFIPFATIAVARYALFATAPFLLAGASLFQDPGANLQLVIGPAILPDGGNLAGSSHERTVETR